MLIEALLDDGHDGGDLDLAALDSLYRTARHGSTPTRRSPTGRGTGSSRFSPATRRRSRSGSDSSRALASFDAMYTRMGALLTAEDLAGESTYNDDLPTVVAGLDAAGLLRESEGALCVFPPGFAGRDGEPLPMIVRKADWWVWVNDATDLAAIRRRVNDFHADRLIYVVDARQSLHFDQVFAVAREAGVATRPGHRAACRVRDGSRRERPPVQDPDRRHHLPVIAARRGHREGVEALDERGSDLTGDTRTETAQAVGIGAVKYADLVNDLERNYVYAVDRMVAMEGNTGPYLQYAHARLATLLAKAGTVDATVGKLNHPAEQRLALLLSGFGGTVEGVADTLQPHQLCAYLYQLAAALSVFYEQCPVLKADPVERATRLALCLATRRTLETGLGLLGIEAPQRM